MGKPNGPPLLRPVGGVAPMAQRTITDHHRPSPKGEATVSTYERLTKLEDRLEKARSAKKAIKVDAQLVAALREHPDEARIWLAVRGAGLL